MAVLDLPQSKVSRHLAASLAAPDGSSHRFFYLNGGPDIMLVGYFSKIII
jgi:hypothetical protein